MVYTREGLVEAFFVSGDAAFLDAGFVLAGALAFSGALALAGALAFSGALALAGAFAFAGALALAGAFAFAGALALAGAFSFADALALAGALSFAGAFALAGAFSFADSLASAGALAFALTLVGALAFTVFGFSTLADSVFTSALGAEATTSLTCSGRVAVSAASFFTSGFEAIIFGFAASGFAARVIPVVKSGRGSIFFSTGLSVIAFAGDAAGNVASREDC